MTFVERFSEIVTPQPGGSDDPLGESVLDPQQAWLRVFEPNDTRIIIGRGQDPTVEIQLPPVQTARIPVHRRVCGGGTVVLSPGMVVVAMRTPRADRFADAWLVEIGHTLAQAVQTCVSAPVTVRGYGDLAIDDRKILGASLRLTGPWCIYLGVLLIADAVPAMEQYLAHPSREPGYRSGRGHRSFCTHAGAYGATTTSVISAVSAVCTAVYGPEVR